MQIRTVMALVVFASVFQAGVVLANHARPVHHHAVNHAAHHRTHARTGGADGAARPLGQLFLAQGRGGDVAPVPSRFPQQAGAVHRHACAGACRVAGNDAGRRAGAARRAALARGRPPDFDTLPVGPQSAFMYFSDLQLSRDLP